MHVYALFLLFSIPTIIIIVEIITQPKGEYEKGQDESQNAAIQTLTEAAMHRILWPVHVLVRIHQKMFTRPMMISIIWRVYCCFRHIEYYCAACSWPVSDRLRWACKEASRLEER